MSDTAFTRLQDLADLGYVITPDLAGGMLYLHHSGGAPRVAIDRDGTIIGWGAWLWLRHLPYENFIAGHDAVRFGLWRFRIATDFPVDLANARIFDVEAH